MGAMNPSGLSLCHLYRPGGFKVIECDFIKVQDGEARICFPKHFLIKGISSLWVLLSQQEPQDQVTV